MKLHLTEIERSDLRQLQRNVSERDSYVKVTVLLLLDEGVSPQQVSKYLGIDDSTVYRYQNLYLSEGLSSYLSNNYKGYWGLLSSLQISELRAELNYNLYIDSGQVVAWVKSRWGISYTREGMVDLLNRIGYSYKQTTQVPCEVDTQKQLAFMETLGSILAESTKNQTETVVYFADAVHPTHNTRSTYAWIQKGTQREQPTLSGRDRVNINAVINAHQITNVIIEESPRVNAQSTQQLYKKIIQANPMAKTIYIISDNARYYKNKELVEWTKTTPIKSIFLPAYSPNLNPIERLWKFLRKKVINTHFYRKKEEFRQAVLAFFQGIDKYKEELETLITLNFRLSNSQSFSF